MIRKEDFMNLGYLYDRNSWTVPKRVFRNSEENKDFRLRVCPTEVRNGDYWFRWYSKTQYHSCITITDSNRIEHQIPIETKNLIEILSTHDSYPSGLVEGTFIISEEKHFGAQSIKLIPEDTREGILKKKLTNIFYSSWSKWKSEVIPGHLYISKSGRIFLALTKINNIFSNGFWGGISNYSKQPKKAKYLLLIDPQLVEEILRAETITKIPQELIDQYSAIYSGGYLLKDLGKFFEEEEFFDKFSIEKQNSFDLLLLFEPLFSRNETKKFLKKILKETAKFRAFCQGEILLYDDLRHIKI